MLQDRVDSNHSAAELLLEHVQTVYSADGKLDGEHLTILDLYVQHLAEFVDDNDGLDEFYLDRSRPQLQQYLIQRLQL